MRCLVTCLLYVLLGTSLAACGDGAAGSGALPPVVDQPAVPTPPMVGQPTVPEPQAQEDVGPWVLDPMRGQSQFAEKCQHCHGANATGGYGPALTNPATCPPCAEYTMLWKRIDEYMPLRNPEACDAACSRDIAAWISNGFSIAASCSVDFRFDSVTAKGFTATVSIVNYRGLDVSAWRLGFTLPASVVITTVANAAVTRSGNQTLLRSLPAAPAIQSGAALDVVLEGTHGGGPTAPADMRLEAPPCFTVLPALKV